MKISPTTSGLIAAICGIAGLAGLAAHAQESGTTDTIVSIAADSQSLPRIAATAVLTRGGTYWWVYPGGMAVPSPMLPLDFTAPIFCITSNEYLVDLTGGTVSVTRFQLAAEAETTNAYAAAVTAQVQSLVDLIAMVQTPTPDDTTTRSMALRARPMDGGGGGFSPDDLMIPAGYPYLTIAPTGTNQLLISVIDTNVSTYYLQMTPVLANTNYPFSIIANGAPGQTNFNVNIGPFENEFFRVLVDTNNPGAGIAVFIDSPANGASVQ